MAEASFNIHSDFPIAPFKDSFIAKNVAHLHHTKPPPQYPNEANDEKIVVPHDSEWNHQAWKAENTVDIPDHSTSSLSLGGYEKREVTHGQMSRDGHCGSISPSVHEYYATANGHTTLDTGSQESNLVCEVSMTPDNLTISLHPGVPTPSRTYAPSHQSSFLSRSNTGSTDYYGRSSSEDSSQIESWKTRRHLSQGSNDTMFCSQHRGSLDDIREEGNIDDYNYWSLGDFD